MEPGKASTDEPGTPAREGRGIPRLPAVGRMSTQDATSDSFVHQRSAHASVVHHFGIDHDEMPRSHETKLPCLSFKRERHQGAHHLYNGESRRMSIGKGRWGSKGNNGSIVPPPSEHPGDAEALLIARSRHGDTAAFNQLVLLHQQTVYTLAYRMLGNPDNAADVTQEALFSAFRAIASFRGGSFRSWLLRITSNACFDYWRRSRRHPGESLEALTDQSEVYDEGQAQQFAADERWDPETLALRTELQALIKAGLMPLPLEQRLAVIPSDIQGL